MEWRGGGKDYTCGAGVEQGGVPCWMRGGGGDLINAGTVAEGRENRLEKHSFEIAFLALISSFQGCPHGFPLSLFNILQLPD